MTQPSDTRAKVLSIIAQQLKTEPENLQEALSLSEQGADEFDMIEITMKLEDQFSLIIEDEDIDKLSTVEGAISYIAGRKTQKLDSSVVH